MEVLINLAVCYTHIGKHEKAISLYLKLLKKNKDYRSKLSTPSFAYIYLSSFSFSLFSRSLPYKSEVLKFSYQIVWVNLSNAYLTKGDLVRAMKAIEQALKMNPKSM